MTAIALATRDLFGVPFADTIARSAMLSRGGAYRFTLNILGGSYRRPSSEALTMYRWSASCASSLSRARLSGSLTDAVGTAALKLNVFNTLISVSSHASSVSSHARDVTAAILVFNRRNTNFIRSLDESS